MNKILINIVRDSEVLLENAQHKLLTDLDETGFGVKYESNLSAYTPPHWHRAVELLLFVQGSVTCNFENSTLHAKPGDIYIINAHELHATRCSRDAVYLCVHLLPSKLCKFVPNFDLLNFSLSFDSEDQERSMAYRQLHAHLSEILRHGSDTGSARLERQARLFAVTALLVTHFSHPLAVEETTLRRSDMSRLEPILEDIQLRHGEELSLDDAASSMGLNKEYFCRLFKKNMGISYLQYVYQVRTVAFCRELEVTDGPISLIAERHGFRDPKTLNHYFREIYGCTPSEKRKFFRGILQEDFDSDEKGNSA